MCIVSSGDITCGMKENEEEKIEVEKLKRVNLILTDHSYKVVFLGDTNVGKTQILNKHTKNCFEYKYNPTNAFDFKSHYYKSTINEGNKIIHLGIWDTPGQEKYREYLPNFVTDAQAIVLVYDVTQKDSFKYVENLLNLAKTKTPENAVYFLVGNKADLEDKRQVEKEEAKKYAEANNMQFFEVSAKNGDNNLDELFKDIVKKCLEKEGVIKEEVIITAIQIEEDETKNKTNDDSHTKVDNTENNFPQQITTQTKNKPCICCRCCPCNK